MRGEHEDGAISSDFSDDSNFDSSSSEHIEETPPSDLKTSKNEKKEKLYRNRSKSPDRYREYDTFYSSESRIRPRANSRDDTHHRSTRRIERRNQMVRSHHLRFDTISNEVYDGALKSIEHWTLFVTGIHEECTVDELRDAFSDCGSIKELKIAHDHRTGYAKGHALIQFAELFEAQRAIELFDNVEFMERRIRVCFCFQSS